MALERPRMEQILVCTEQTGAERRELRWFWYLTSQIIAYSGPDFAGLQQIEFFAYFPM